MPVTVDAIKDLSIRGMKAKFGDSVGTAYGFLMFGGFGVPGLVDGATLVATAKTNSEAGNDFTMDMAVGLVTDVAKAALAKGLEFPAASTVLEFTGLTAEALASASTIVVSGLLSPSAIAPEPEPHFASSKDPEPATDSAPEPATDSTPEPATESVMESETAQESTPIPESNS